MALTYAQRRAGTLTIAIGARMAGVYLLSEARRSVVDNVAPVISIISPTAGSTLSSSSAAIAIRVKDYGVENADNGILKRAFLYATFSDGTHAELVHDGTSFSATYSASSTRTPITGGFDFSIVRTGGWRTNPTITAYGIDAFANESTLTSFAFVFNPADDIVAPTFAANSPAAASTVTINQVITLDVLDASSIARTMLFVAFADGTNETVYNGSAFTAGYSAFSTLSTVGTTKRFAVRRAAGWKEDPTFTAYARDISGNEHLVATSIAFDFTPTPPDTTAPSISGLSPTAGSTLSGSQAPITLDIIGVSGATTFIQASYASGAIQEPVYDSVTGFGPMYSVDSSWTPVGSDAHLSLRRGPGWGQNPVFRFFSIDPAGNILDTTRSFLFAGTPASTGITVAPTLQYRSEFAETEEGDFGTDILVFDDLDETMEPRGGPQVLLQALGKRFTTRRGQLPFHKNYGRDLRDYLNETVTDDLLFRAKADVELEAEADERVLSADAQVQYRPSEEKMLVALVVQTATGPYRLVMSVTRLGVELITEEA